MNLDEFEKRLSRTPVPPLPADLRRQILDAVRREQDRTAVIEPRPGVVTFWLMVCKGLRGLASPSTLFVGAWVVVALLASVGSWLDTHRQPVRSTTLSAHPKPSRLEIVAALRIHRAEITALAHQESAGPDGETTPPLPAAVPSGLLQPRSDFQPPRKLHDKTGPPEVA
ncbi:MAG: hypothetical protein JNK85_17050 [Verrucomicrobiales bacterium]|nr:hypothetical protein [Verrucomicrobiales bacterium]